MEKRARGRPAKDRAAQRDHLMRVATEVLLSAGFARFTIDAVAKAGGLAKKTIYQMVPNREALVGAIVASWTDRFAGEDGTGEREIPLAALLARIHRVALSREAVSLFRMIVSDPEAREKLGSIYGENGIERGVGSVVARLADETDLPTETRESVARALLATLIGEPLRRAALGLEAPYDLTDEAVEARVSASLRLFAPLLEGRGREG